LSVRTEIRNDNSNRVLSRAPRRGYPSIESLKVAKNDKSQPARRDPFAAISTYALPACNRKLRGCRYVVRAKRAIIVLIAADSTTSMADDEPKSELSYAQFQAMCDGYEREPTLANYVRLRRTFGLRAGTTVGRFHDFEPLSIATELGRLSIDPALVDSALDGNQWDDGLNIDRLVLRIMECLIERDQIEKRGSAHVQSRKIAISDSLVDFLIVAMLETFEDSIPSSLVLLIRERLCGANPDRHKEHLLAHRRREAVAIAAVKFPKGKVSIRTIAKILSVQPSTISRAFPNGSFQREVDKFRREIDAFGLRGNGAAQKPR
jgi:hypothetical protein